MGFWGGGAAASPPAARGGPAEAGGRRGGFPGPARRRGEERGGERGAHGAPQGFGRARVYLKVAVLVEAGEAVRHLAAFPPPPTPRCAPLRSARAGDTPAPRRAPPTARPPRAPPPEEGKESGDCAPTSGRPLARPAHAHALFRPGPPRPPEAARARWGPTAASTSGGKGQRARGEAGDPCSPSLILVRP